MALNEAKAASKTKRAGLSEALRRRGRSWDLGEFLWPMKWDLYIYTYVYDIYIYMTYIDAYNSISIYVYIYIYRVIEFTINGILASLSLYGK